MYILWQLPALHSVFKELADYAMASCQLKDAV
jgi:hypothetical protein